MTTNDSDEDMAKILAERESQLFGELRSFFADYDAHYRGANRFETLKKLDQENDAIFWRNQKRRKHMVYREQELLLPYDHLISLISDWLDDVKEELVQKMLDQINPLYRGLDMEFIKDNLSTLMAFNQEHEARVKKKVRVALHHSLHHKILPYCKAITQTWRLHECTHLFRPSYHSATREHRVDLYDALEEYKDQSIKGALYTKLLRVWRFEGSADIPDPQQHAYAFRLLTQAEGFHTNISMFSDPKISDQVLSESAFRSLVLGSCTTRIAMMLLARGATQPEILANLEDLNIGAYGSHSFPFDHFHVAPFFRRLPKLEALTIFSPVKDLSAYEVFWESFFTLPPALECFSLRLEGTNLEVDNVLMPVMEWANRVSAEYKDVGKVSPLRVFEICVLTNSTSNVPQEITEEHWYQLKRCFDPEVFPYLEYTPNYSPGERYE